MYSKWVLHDLCSLLGLETALGISLKWTNKCDFVLLTKLRVLCTSNLKWPPFDVVNLSGSGYMNSKQHLCSKCIPVHNVCGDSELKLLVHIGKHGGTIILVHLWPWHFISKVILGTGLEVVKIFHSKPVNWNSHLWPGIHLTNLAQTQNDAAQ